MTTMKPLVARPETIARAIEALKGEWGRRHRISDQSMREPALAYQRRQTALEEILRTGEPCHWVAEECYKGERREVA